MKKLEIREQEKIIATEKDIISLAEKINELIEAYNLDHPTITVNPNEGTGNSNK